MMANNKQTPNLKVLDILNSSFQFGDILNPVICEKSDNKIVVQFHFERWTPELNSTES